MNPVHQHVHQHHPKSFKGKSETTKRKYWLVILVTGAIEEHLSGAFELKPEMSPPVECPLTSLMSHKISRIAGRIRSLLCPMTSGQEPFGERTCLSILNHFGLLVVLYSSASVRLAARKPKSTAGVLCFMRLTSIRNPCTAISLHFPQENRGPAIWVSFLSNWRIQISLHLTAFGQLMWAYLFLAKW